MNYQIDVDEAKKLIGDMALEIFALRRDNIKMAETLQKIQERQESPAKMPHKVIDMEREKESNG